MSDRGKCLRILLRTHCLLCDVEEAINRYIDVTLGIECPPDEGRVEEYYIFDNPKKWFIGVMKRLGEEKRRSEQSGSYEDAIGLALNLVGDKYVHDTIKRITTYAESLWERFPGECLMDALEIWDFLLAISNEWLHYLVYQNNVTAEKPTTDEAINTPPIGGNGLEMTSDNQSITRGKTQNVKLKNEESGSEDGHTLPKELNTEKAITLLQKAVKIGLCDDSYNWLKSKALLAYFADKASEYLGLSKGKYYDNEIDDDNDKTFWKPFETLFGRKNLSQSKRDYKRKGLPRDYKDVDNLFK